MERPIILADIVEEKPVKAEDLAKTFPLGKKIRVPAIDVLDSAETPPGTIITIHSVSGDSAIISYESTNIQSPDSAKQPGE